MKNVALSAKLAVAIDGPVGAGKSTIARECAERLGFVYVDTGALYRALGVYCDSNGVNVHNDSETAKFIEKSQVKVGDLDYSDKIRTPEASMLASRISANPAIREELLELQRSYAKENSVIMDGRDIGTVVLPDADVKIFLTADPKERAKRRYDELVSKADKADGIKLSPPSYEDVLADLIKRDFNDSNREHAPLKQADDAIVVDTTGNTFEQSVEMVMKIVKGIINDR